LKKVAGEGQKLFATKQSRGHETPEVGSGRLVLKRSCNYRARRQRESLEAIDARAAARATAKKGTAGTAPLSEESKQPEPAQVRL